MLRTMNPADRETFIRLCSEFYRSDAVLHSIPEKNIATTFDMCMNGSPYARGYLFEHEGKVAGYALLALTYSNEVGGMVVWLEEAYILPEFQGKGLGSELFRFVEQEFAGQVKRLRLEVTGGNEGAIRLYQRLGFERFDYMQMVKDL